MQTADEVDTVGLVFLGSFVKPFGIRGELKFNPSDDFWEAVLDSKQLVGRRDSRDGVVEEAVAIVRARPHKNCFIVTVDGVDDRNAAEAAVGTELFIDADNADVEMPDDEKPFQVVGSRVVLENGTEIGTVTSMMFSSAHRVYEVTGKDGVVLIPVVPEFIVDRDTSKHVITVRPIPGLIES